MELEDAANLLIAVGGAAVTREAGDAIKKYRSMPGTIYPGQVPPIEYRRLLSWLAPMGCAPSDIDEERQTYKLQSGLGDFLQFIIAEAVRGSLASFLQEAVTVYLLSSRERKTVGKKIIGKDLGLTITFARTTPRVDVSFERHWGGNTTGIVFQVSFFSKAAVEDPLWSQHPAMRVSATFTQDVLFGMGLVLAGKLTPKSLKSGRRLIEVYEQQAVDSITDPEDRMTSDTPPLDEVEDVVDDEDDVDLPAFANRSALKGRRRVCRFSDDSPSRAITPALGPSSESLQRRKPQ
jgi:hypothetical protein